MYQTCCALTKGDWRRFARTLSIPFTRSFGCEIPPEPSLAPFSSCSSEIFPEPKNGCVPVLQNLLCVLTEQTNSFH